jgi:hypothetical protein
MAPIRVWEENRFQLINWFDMQKFSAHRFYMIGSILERIRNRLGIETTGDPAFALGQSQTPLGEQEEQDLISFLQRLEIESEDIGLELTVQRVTEIRGEMGFHVRQHGHKMQRRVMQARISELDTLVRLEMERVLFMYVPSDRAAFYGKEDLFEEEVKDKFTSASFDIKESGNSYAAARDTACVFHLMRVLEIGLAVFAKEFSISADHTNWHNIIEQIEARVRAMASDPNRKPGWKEDQEFYSQAASHFMFLKDAWRNYTAHARGKYTQEEAQTIMMNVRSFMQKLATKLKEA